MTGRTSGVDSVYLNFAIADAYEEKPDGLHLPGFYDIVCMNCSHWVRMDEAQRQRFEAQTCQSAVCPGCAQPYCLPAEPSRLPPSALSALMAHGSTVAQVLSHRGRVPDAELDANIGLILLDKETARGLRVFSPQERHVYAVQAMVREVNNGGFDQFFFNGSGELAFDLVPALDAMGSIEKRSIARRALERFGKPRSLKEVTRHKHLAKITADGATRLWDDLDDEFYRCTENIETMVLDHIDRHRDAFDA
jgi:hypothetical protein